MSRSNDRFLGRFLAYAMVFSIATALAASSAMAQADKSSELFKTLKQRDSELFGKGFNECRMDVFREILSDNIEFFHDVNGFTDSKDQFIKGMEIGLCREGKAAVKRILNEDSLEVFPLNSEGKLYGAIQNGVHYFGDEGEARFTHLWLLEEGEWKLARVLSFDHKARSKK